MKQMIRSNPDEMGRLFVKETYNNESLSDSAVRKFGFASALRVLDECLPSDNEWDELHRNSDCVLSFVLAASSGRKRRRSYDCAPLFVLAASGDVGDVPLGVIYHLARRNVDGLLRF
jgi:hypothetical protein